MPRLAPVMNTVDTASPPATGSLALRLRRCAFALRGGFGLGLRRRQPRGHLDLDTHARIGEAGEDGGRGRADVAEILAEDRRDAWPVRRLRHDVVGAHDV